MKTGHLQTAHAASLFYSGQWQSSQTPKTRQYDAYDATRRCDAGGAFVRSFREYAMQDSFGASASVISQNPTDFRPGLGNHLGGQVWVRRSYDGHWMNNKLLSLMFNDHGGRH
jgi:hypothetical protein